MSTTRTTYELGQRLGAELFEEGDIVDVVGKSKGRGFAGGVKRHHFAGGPKTHGQSDRHRAPGSIGSGTTPGRVRKGLHMAGHMGDEQRDGEEPARLRERHATAASCSSKAPSPAASTASSASTQDGQEG